MSTSQNDDASILARVIVPNGSNLPVGVATEVLKWSFDELDRQRMSELAAKARQGTLTSDEQAEVESFERVTCFLGLVKSQARRSLQDNSGQ